MLADPVFPLLVLSLQSSVVKEQAFPAKGTQTRVKTATWNSGNSPLCDRCDCAQVQDEVHALLMCRDEGLCALRSRKRA